MRHQSWQAGFDSRLGHTEDFNNGNCVWPASCLVLMCGCEEIVRAQYCNWLVTRTASLRKHPTAQASGYGRRRPLVALLKEYKKRA